jgi:peptidyl-tRNA hydrolase
VVRKDLKPGAILAQSVHASFAFSQEHPEITKKWMMESNYIGILEIESEEKLFKLINDALREGIASAMFREPDLDNSLTAIALEPGPKSKKLCSNLKLALRDI